MCLGWEAFGGKCEVRALDHSAKHPTKTIVLWGGYMVSLDCRWLPAAAGPPSQGRKAGWTVRPRATLPAVNEDAAGFSYCLRKLQKF